MPRTTKTRPFPPVVEMKVPVLGWKDKAEKVKQLATTLRDEMVRASNEVVVLQDMILEEYYKHSAILGKTYSGCGCKFCNKAREILAERG